jgi:hypothetical protein
VVNVVEPSQPADTACCAAPQRARELTPAVAALADLPGPEQREELEALVVRQVRGALLMTDDEDLPYDVSYFDLGLTSLLVAEIKGRLETLLGRGIDANVLFNSPTVARLLSYLGDELLADVLVPVGPARQAAPTAAPDDLVDVVLRDLYRA